MNKNAPLVMISFFLSVLLIFLASPLISTREFFSTKVISYIFCTISTMQPTNANYQRTAYKWRLQPRTRHALRSTCLFEYNFETDPHDRRDTSRNSQLAVLFCWARTATHRKPKKCPRARPERNLRRSPSAKPLGDQ